MKRLFLLAALTLPLLAQDGFDFKSLDKLGANATNRNVITLDGDLLKMASGFLGSGKEADSIKPLVDSLKGIYIRSYEFAKEGMYNESDLDGLRAYLKQGQWNRIVESREAKEVSEIYLQPLPGARLGGVAIISAEPKEVTVVYISGNLKQDDLAKLSGTMGIPDIKLGAIKPGAKSKSKQDEKKADKDDQDQ